MRTVMMTLLLASLLAAPSFGVINVRLMADRTSMVPGATTTIHVLAQGTAAGIYSLAGDIVATGDTGLLISSPGSMVFDPNFYPSGLFTPKPGTPGTNGGWTSFGTEQTNWGTPDATLGKYVLVEVCHYTVTMEPPGWGGGYVSLTFVPKTISGYKPLEVDKAGVIGWITPVTISGAPEPMTLALLSLGGLMLARRRV